ncbi:MAG: hypothetical protein QXW09_08060 [Thermoproteota archaeon]
MELNRLLDKARGIRDSLERKIFFTGILVEALKSEGEKPIIVGGTAVEFYTLGGYSTLDLDLVYKEREKLSMLLEKLGFRKHGRHWYSEELDLAVEVPGFVLSGSIEKLTKIEIGGLTAYVIGIEDIIADRLRAYVHWKSDDDGRWAKRMMILHKDKIDWSYLEEKSRSDGTQEALEQLRVEVEKSGS